MKEYKNYLFDLYGTLVDIHTNEDSLPFWRNVSRYLGMQGIDREPMELKERYLSEIARQEADLAAQLPQGAQGEIDIGKVLGNFYEGTGITPDDREVAQFARVFRLLSIRRLRLFPGVIPMLESLRRRGKNVYLLSNAQALFTRPELTLLGLDTRLDGILLSSEAGRKKPDPAFFQMILTQYDLDPAATVMVGNDDLCDCHGAANAGLDSYYVFTPQSPIRTTPLPGNCTELNKITDLLEFL